jgi:hypothetical protein
MQKRSLSSTLDILESRLRMLIEGNARRLFPANAQGDLAHALVAAMQANLVTDEQGNPLAPNLYVIQAHPEHAAAIQSHPQLVPALQADLQAAASQAGVHFTAPPVLRLEADLTLPVGEIRISALHETFDLSPTAAMPAAEAAAQALPEIPANAYLVVDGTQIVPLLKPLVNIGRWVDNDLVIADPRVSRNHAQLRLIRGCYVLFDMDSTGGTQVNGQPVQQQALFSGDVISLAGFPLVFGQEPATGEHTQSLTVQGTNGASQGK